MSLEAEIISMLGEREVEIVRFVDVSGLPEGQNRGLPNAIIFCVLLTSSYMRKVMEDADYVEKMILADQVDHDEFHLKELKAGELADCVSDLLISKGYRAYSQSDNNLIATGAWNEKYSRTLLPHKTIAVLSGMGWIGRNNLLVTPEYGSGLCIGTVLTDAPLDAMKSSVAENGCGACRACIRVCRTNALLGNTWERTASREDIIDIRKCTTCMRCMLHCVYTRKYLKHREGEE